LQKARENQLIESGFYPGIEQIINDFGTDINERETPADPNMPTHIDPATGLPADPANNPAAVPNPDHPLNKANAVDPNVDPENNVVPFKKKAANDEEVVLDAMANRIRDAALVDGSTPRTLYIYRPVLNWRDIAKFYTDQGVTNVYGGPSEKADQTDMHVTICYSKTPVDWLKVGADSWGNSEDGSLTVTAGGPRVNEQFGNYLVLAFANSDLAWRHMSVRERAGASWEYDDYTPHISISKEPGAIDPLTLKAWTGPIVLGPEVFEEIKVEGAVYDGVRKTIGDSVLYQQSSPMPQPINITVDVHMPKQGKVRRTLEYKDGKPVGMIETEEGE